MSRMDRLFGVTMAERGVSQLVSVSLADAEKIAESLVLRFGASRQGSLWNFENAKTLVKMVAPLLREQRPATCPHGCDTALENALITAPDKRSPALLGKLDAVAGRLLKK